MTSTPNSSFDNIENRNGLNSKTAHNTIGRRKSKRQSKRTPVPLIVNLLLDHCFYYRVCFFQMIQQVTEETVACL